MKIFLENVCTYRESYYLCLKILKYGYKTTFKAGFIVYNMNGIFDLRAIKDMKTFEKRCGKTFF